MHLYMYQQKTQIFSVSFEIVWIKNLVWLVKIYVWNVFNLFYNNLYLKKYIHFVKK